MLDSYLRAYVKYCYARFIPILWRSISIKDRNHSISLEVFTSVADNPVVKRVTLLFAVFVLLVSTTDAVSAQTILWGDSKPGHFDVGFKLFPMSGDSSKANPLQISIWYPAQSPGTATPMRYVDYILLSASEQGEQLTEEQKNNAVKNYKKRLTSFGISETAIDTWFETKMAAIRDTKVATQKFPLILIGQGNFQSAHDQAVISEYLATYGYVVATSPSPTRTKPMETEADVLPTATRQADDMQWIVSILKKEAYIDASRIGVIAHSFGARSALLLAFKIQEIKAIVSLDGGIGNREGKGLIEKSPLYRPEKLYTPILHIYEDQETFMVPDLNLLNSLRHSDRYLVRLQNIRHHEFSSYGLAGGVIPGLSSSPAGLKRKWKVICAYTLNFVDAFLKADRLAMKFIQRPPDDNGFSSQDVTMRTIKASELTFQ